MFTSRIRHTRYALVTVVQTCALPIMLNVISQPIEFLKPFRVDKDSKIFEPLSQRVEIDCLVALNHMSYATCSIGDGGVFRPYDVIGVGQWRGPNEHFLSEQKYARIKIPHG